MTKRPTKPAPILNPTHAFPRVVARDLHMREGKNPTTKRGKPAKTFSPKLIAEFNTAFVKGLEVLNAQGMTWVKISDIIGLGESQVKRIRWGQRNANLPAFIHLADALGVSLVELLCMGVEE